MFLSYRRERTAGDASALARDLTGAFGPERVFLDIDMPGGAQWPARLRDEATAAPVMLALIGPDWLTVTDRYGRRRIDDEADWVRREIELALGDPGKLLIPVLLDGASLPPPEALPPALAGLADRQGRPLGHAAWCAQAETLIRDVEEHTRWRRRESPLAQQYVRAQLHRSETALRNVAEPVLPDLLPFQVEPPATERLTSSVARQLRRAVEDRARYTADGLLTDPRPRRIVVVGGPGSGKTTLLNMIAKARAAAASTDPEAPVPVHLRVRELPPRDGYRLTSAAADDVDRWFDLRPGRDFFDELFASGRGMLIVDGIDEAPGVRERNELLERIDLFADRYERATVIVSSRIVGYDPRRLAGSFEHFELAPFATDQVRQFLAYAMSRSAADRLAKRIMEDARLSALAESPLLLSIIARVVAERGTVDKLPRERHSLYDLAVDLMLTDWDAERGVETAERPADLDRGQIRQALETVAYRVHAGLVQRDSTAGAAGDRVRPGRPQPL